MIRKLTILVVLFLVSLPALAESVDTAWVRINNSPAGSQFGARAMDVDDSGNVYVTGGGGDYVTITYCPDGDTAWVRSYDGPANGHDGAHAIAVDGSGNVYVTGASDGGGTGWDYCTIKYYPNGDTAWVRRYNGGWGSNAQAIAVDDSGYVYVTGNSEGGWPTDMNYVTIKYYPNGDTAWVRTYDGPGSGSDFPSAIAVDDSGYVYVTGSSVGGSLTMDDYTTIKYYPNGDTAWVRRYSRTQLIGESATAITVDGSGYVYVTGYSLGPTACPDYATIKYYPNGDTAWVRRYDGPGCSDYASDIAVDYAKNVYVTGGSGNAPGGGVAAATVKYDSSGNQLWVRRYSGPANGYGNASAIAVDGSANVYVTGRSGSLETDGDYTTIKYDPSGNELWVETYDGPGDDSDDRAQEIAVDGSGYVYVSGYYATIKYVQNFSQVSIIDFAFVPQVDTIAVGDSVRWTNNGAVPHTSTSDVKSSWDSGTLNPGESFTFQFESDGVYPYHCTFHPSMVGTIEVEPPSTVPDETGSREKPTEFTLSQNYPNPFNQTTKIEFTLAKSGFVSLNIYDILGRKVRTLASEHLFSGYKSVLWDGKNDEGKDVASGIYFYQLSVADFSETKKLVLLK